MFGAALSYPVIRSRQQTLNVNFGFDALDSDITISPNGTPRARASYDALRVLRLGEDYALSDLWLGADRSAVNLLSVRISEGLKLLGASINGDSLTSPRLGEQTGFFKFNFEASRTQTLFTPWEGASLGLMGLRSSCSSIPASKRPSSKNRSTSRPSTTCSTTGARPGRI